MISLDILPNLAPYENVLTPIPTQADLTIPAVMTYTFTVADHLIDDAGDNILINFSVTGPGAPDVLLFSMDYTLGVATVTATPNPDNAYAVLYTMNFELEDIYDGTPNLI